jgi:predicted MFS family arabinose efflux permease
MIGADLASGILVAAMALPGTPLVFGSQALRTPMLFAWLCAFYDVPEGVATANASFAQATPADQRSQAFGIAQGGIGLGQGIAIVIAGAAAEHASPSFVVAAAGGAGVLCALALTLTTARAERQPDARQPRWDSSHRR